MSQDVGRVEVRRSRRRARDFDQYRGRVTRRRHGPWRELSSTYVHEVIENERMAKPGTRRYYKLRILGTDHWTNLGQWI